MQIIKKENAQWKSLSDICQVGEYFMDDKTLDVALIKISGRQPESGFIVNNKSSVVCYCIAGSGSVNGNAFAAGDAVGIPRGEKYWFDGNIEITMSCAPAWVHGACEIVKDNGR